jgi:hypothetical protein
VDPTAAAHRPGTAPRHKIGEMYNWDLQKAIAAFVDWLRPTGDLQNQLYVGVLHAFAGAASGLLTLLGFPPVQ